MNLRNASYRRPHQALSSPNYRRTRFQQGMHGMGDFYDDYGNLVIDGGDGSLYVQQQDNVTYTTSVDNQGGPVLTSPDPVTPDGTPSQQQAAQIDALKNPNTSTAVDWLSKLADAVPKALQLYNAQQIAAVNIARAKQNLPPLNPGLYGPQVGIGVTPQTQNLLLYAALGIGALMLLGKKR